MILARVVGTVVSTVKHAAYEGLRLLLVEPVDERLVASRPEFIAVDRAQAGLGDVVLVLREGTGVRQIFERPGAFRFWKPSWGWWTIWRVHHEQPQG